MSLVVLENPEKDVNGHLSKWQAVHHPIEFVLQRQDQQVVFKYLPNSLTTVRIKVSGPPPTTVAIGQRIKYVSSSQTYTWTIIGFAGVNNDIIITDGTIPGTVNNGYVLYLDAFTNYYVETRILVANSGNTYVIAGTMRNKASLDGIIKLRVQEWLRTVAVFLNEFNYDVINKAMIGEGSRYSVQYSEAFNGKQTAFTDISGLRFWTNSTKQIQEVFGSNMGEYVPTYDDTRTDRAKFQSVFKRPTYFVGLPFSMSWIYSDNMTNRQLTREERQYDINGVEIGTSSTNIIASQRTFANRLMIEQGYGADVKTIELWIEAGDPIPDAGLDLNAYQAGDIFTPFVENPVINAPDPTS